MNTGLYILELLEEQDYVIFPGLGAFTVERRPASWTKDNSTLLPPSRTFGFNPALKINDGILPNHISARENIPASEVYANLEKLSDEFRYKLDNGETVTFDDFGELTHDEKGYHFEPFEAATAISESFGLAPAIIKTVPRPKTVVAKETPKKEHRKKKKKNRIWLIAVPVVAALAVVAFLLLKPDSNKTDVPEKTEPAAVAQNIAPKPENKHPEEKAPGVDSSAIISESQIEPQDTVAAVTEPVVAENKVREEAKKEEKKEEVKEPQSISVQGEHPQKGLFYVIGGSFQDKKNAEKFFEKSKKNGYEPVYIGLIHGYHMIALGIYSSEKEAITARAKVWRQTGEAEAWIYEVE